MRTRRFRFRWLHPSRAILNGCAWLCAFAVAGFAIAPAPAQGRSGATAIAAGAAAAATASAPAPKRTAASAGQGNGTTLSPGTNAAGPSKAVEDASGAIPPDVARLAAKLESGPPLKGVALQCANLLKLATNLKTAVSQTTKDELSVPVVRDAGEIADMAHKMRDQDAR
jgi:hypothetical protein